MAGNADRVADLHTLARIWTRRGLKVLEMPGWEDRGRSSTISFDVLGCHHTAASVDVDRILRDGRSDVPGPLCNVALHANGDVVLVASGRANHFGVATWSSSRALGVEATGPPFPNYDAYVQLAAGFCEWKGQNPTRVVRADVGIPVYLVAAHKEVATFDDGRYGRKPNPAFDDPGRLIQGVRLIDTFRADVAAALTEEEDDMYDADAEARLFQRIEQAERRTARYVDHGEVETTGSSNHHKLILDRLAAFQAAVGARLDALEELVTPAAPPAVPMDEPGSIP